MNRHLSELLAALAFAAPATLALAASFGGIEVPPPPPPRPVTETFEGDYKLVFHLAPPITNKPDPATGVAKKSSYGPWMMKAFRMLARLRRFRGGALDVFGRSEERKMERRLIVEYEALIDEVLGKLAPHNHALAVELSRIPEHIRGYGHVKLRHLKDAKARETVLLGEFRAAQAPSPSVKVAA